jgi:outer membrane protein assembly factor BamB
MRTLLVSLLSVMGASTYLISGGWATAHAQDVTSHGWEEAWRIRISRGVGSTPVWADSQILVASLDRNLHAIRLEPEPRVVWDENQKSGLPASPLALGSRIVIVESGREGRLVALDRATRREAWAVKLGDLIAAPLAADDRLYAVTSTGLVAAVTPAGNEVWRRELETAIAARPARIGGALLVASAEGVLYALDPATGDVRERVDPAAGPIWGDPAVLDDAHAIYATLEGQVFTVSPDLEVEARRSFPSHFYAGPRLEDGALLLAGHEGTIWSYDWRNSEIRWRRELAATVRAAPAPGPRAVAIGDLGGNLYQLDRETGELLWHARLDGAITAAPLVHGSLVIVGTEAGTLYAFRPTSPASR